MIAILEVLVALDTLGDVGAAVSDINDVLCACRIGNDRSHAVLGICLGSLKLFKKPLGILRALGSNGYLCLGHCVRLEKRGCFLFALLFGGSFGKGRYFRFFRCLDLRLCGSSLDSALEVLEHLVDIRSCDQRIGSDVTREVGLDESALYELLVVSVNKSEIFRLARYLGDTELIHHYGDKLCRVELSPIRGELQAKRRLSKLRLIGKILEFVFRTFKFLRVKVKIQP